MYCLDIDVGEVANVEEGCDFNIIKSIRSKGAEVSNEGDSSLNDCES